MTLKKVRDLRNDKALFSDGKKYIPLLLSAIHLYSGPLRQVASNKLTIKQLYFIDTSIYTLTIMFVTIIFVVLNFYIMFSDTIL